MAIDQQTSNHGLRTANVESQMSNVEAFVIRHSSFDFRPEASECGRLIAASKAMREILEVVRRSAPTEAPVLIYGERDTGKKLIACEIHRQSRRVAGPFVHVACGALRESDLAEKLFGRDEQGATQGVPGTEHGESQSKSCITPCSPLPARGGTLYLEDVTQLPLWCQARLLDALQQASQARVAQHATAGIDVRVIASSTIDLPTAVAQRVFLSSLYYYLKVVEIHVPPLRQRAQDICSLAEIYLAVANATRAKQGGKPPCRFAHEALQCLVNYDWPGNTQQLASIVAHAVLLTDGDEITPIQIMELLGDVAPNDDAETISVPLTGGLKEIERAVVVAVIQRCRGNKAEAARVLRLHRREVYRILQPKALAKADFAPLPLALDPSLGDCAANAYS